MPPSVQVATQRNVTDTTIEGTAARDSPKDKKKGHYYHFDSTVHVDACLHLIRNHPIHYRLDLRCYQTQNEVIELSRSEIYF